MYTSYSITPTHTHIVYPDGLKVVSGALTPEEVATETTTGVMTPEDYLTSYPRTDLQSLKDEVVEEEKPKKPKKDKKDKK